MPPELASPAAPAAGSPSPAPAAPPAPASPAPSPTHPTKKHADGDPFLAVVPDLAKRLFSDPEVKDQLKDKKKTAAAAEPAPAAGEPKPGEPKPGEPARDPGIKARRKVDQRPDLPLRKSAAEPAPAAAAPVEIELNDTELEPEEREMITEAAEAAELLPSKHSGLVHKIKKFIKENIEYSNREGFDPESDEYKTWLEENRPRLTRAEQREIDAARVSSRVRKEVEREVVPIKHSRFREAEEPKIAEFGKKIFSEVSGTVLPAEIIQEIVAANKEKPNGVGIAEVRKKYALEFDTAEPIVNRSIESLKEYARFARVDRDTGLPMVEFDPKNPQHRALQKMQDDICSDFSENGGAARQKKIGNGPPKWFVTRQEWYQLEPTERSKYWTFTQQEIIDRAKKQIPGIVQQAIAAKRAEIERLGGKIERTPAPTPNPAAAVAPGPRPSPSPAVSSSGTDTISAGAKRIASLLSR